jgi:hypothetical protein
MLVGLESAMQLAVLDESALFEHSKATQAGSLRYGQLTFVQDAPYANGFRLIGE